MADFQDEREMAADWRGYQEEVSALFRSMGLDSQVNVTLQGVRTKHAIDVVVKSRHIGFDVIWLIECKHWKTPVSKLHVLALREIVADLGADRGILLCEAGFQSGAVEAATLTNVQISSLERVRDISCGEIFAMRLRELYDRLESCRVQYWNLSKDARIEHGLRGEIGELSYSGDRVIELCDDLVTRALRGNYPFRVDTLSSLIAFGKDKQFGSPNEIISITLPMVEELEQKLAKAVNPGSLPARR